MSGSELHGATPGATRTTQGAIPTRERFLGAMYGLAYGDALSFPAVFHRFGGADFPRKRHEFLWRTNADLDRQGIARLTLPFTHRLPAALLEPFPTDDTESALLSLRAILRAEGQVNGETFLAVWRDEVLPQADKVRLSFSGRAALENLKHGLLPPHTGDDNPLHFEDSAASRAVPIGLYCVGDPERAAELAALDARITNAEDGIYGAQAIAAAAAALAAGWSIPDALSAARRCFPAGTWIAHNDGIAQRLAAASSTPADLVLALSRELINTVYSYGSLAPETVPAALVLVERCQGDLNTACLYANTLAKASDSLPALVGALCGAHQGVSALTDSWRAMLRTVRGVCLPSLAGTDLEAETLRLYALCGRE